MDKYRRELNGIEIIPVIEFLADLWVGKIIWIANPLYREFVVFSYISRIEKGITVPSVATFYRIVSALGRSVELTPIQ